MLLEMRQYPLSLVHCQDAFMPVYLRVIAETTPQITHTACLQTELINHPTSSPAVSDIYTSRRMPSTSEDYPVSMADAIHAPSDTPSSTPDYRNDAGIQPDVSDYDSSVYRIAHKRSQPTTTTSWFFRCFHLRR
jgi:hypothetical protein